MHLTPWLIGFFTKVRTFAFIISCSLIAWWQTKKHRFVIGKQQGRATFLKITPLWNYHVLEENRFCIKEGNKHDDTTVFMDRWLWRDSSLVDAKEYLYQQWKFTGWPRVFHHSQVSSLIQRIGDSESCPFYSFAMQLDQSRKQTSVIYTFRKKNSHHWWNFQNNDRYSEKE